MCSGIRIICEDDSVHLNLTYVPFSDDQSLLHYIQSYCI